MTLKQTWLACLAWTSAAGAAEAVPDSAPGIARVVVSAGRTAQALDRTAPSATRLGLTLRETPATVDLVGSERMETRGYASAEQAVDSMPGVSSGGAPGSPSQFSMRGFTGGQVMVLRDGIYLGPADMTYRSQNSFNLAGVEVLKGPGSVLYGQGAIAGTVNVISKQPGFDGNAVDAIASRGRFGASQAGVGGNLVLGEGLALRADLSRNARHGHVQRARSESVNATLSLLWRPEPGLDLRLSLDYLTDHPSTYYGTPLVPAAFAGSPLEGVVRTNDGSTLDARMRYLNYNVGDARIASTQYLPRAGLRWKVGDDTVLTSDSYYFHAERAWQNAENTTFDPASSRVERDRFFVWHKQRLYGNRSSIAINRPLWGMTNRFVAGIDYSRLDFLRARGFPDGDSVDPFQPVPGNFGPLIARRSPTRWANAALFLENALDVGGNLKVVSGARVERFRLERENYGPDGSFQAATSFERDFRPKNWRLGLVYEGAGSLAPYVQYSTGQDPVGANVLLVNAGQDFDLSRSRQVEAGVKGGLGQRGAFTLAYYVIERRNLLTQTASEVVDTAGMQGSRGLEMALDYRPYPAWNVEANLAWTHAAYRNFVDTGSGVDASGNRPPNVPGRAANLWVRHGGAGSFGGLPLQLGAGLRYLGPRYGNTANTLVLQHHTLLQLHASYKLDRNLSLHARVDNATGKAYAEWADINYPGQVQLGAPRSYELALVAHF